MADTMADNMADDLADTSALSEIAEISFTKQIKARPKHLQSSDPLESSLIPPKPARLVTHLLVIAKKACPLSAAVFRSRLCSSLASPAYTAS